MITDRQKNSIIAFINRLAIGEVIWLNDFQPEERDYILELCEMQTGRNGFRITTNGTAKDKATITKFRKEFIINKY